MKNIAIIYHDADFDGKLSNEVCRYHLKRLHPNAAIHSYGWDYGHPAPMPLLLGRVRRDPLLTEDEGGDPIPLAPDSMAAPHQFRSAHLQSDWSLYDYIYIVDLSVDELMSRPELREKIVWIDHHKSAIEKWTPSGFEKYNPGFAGYRIDGVAACRLCWQWFVRRNRVGVTYTRPVSKQDFVDRVVEEPSLIRLAGEYDIWDHRDPNGKALQFGLRTLDVASFHTACEEQFSGSSVADSLLKSYIQVGHAIKTYMDKQSEEYSAAYSQTIKWEGLTFCALNIGQRGDSDLLRGGIKPEHDACFAWRWTGAEVMVSLYHAPGREHHDLSKIAVKHGGGGHKGACGFRVTLGKLAEILC